ncbi:oligosaccharide flippase family protein [Dorea sp.]
MSRKQALIRGTAVLTVTSLSTRFMGFFYRMFLSHTFGEENVGLYQLVFPVYALGISLSCAGMELALSRCVAREAAAGRMQKARELLKTSLIFTFFISCMISLFIRQNADTIALTFLRDSRCSNLLFLLSYTFPFASIHSCICGYSLGLKQTKIPAVSQLLEQAFRILSVIVICMYCSGQGQNVSIAFAVAGLTFGEIAASFYSLHSIRQSRKPIPRKSTGVFLSPAVFRRHLQTLLEHALPLTASRVFLNILQSVEAVSIPVCLQYYGMPAAQSLQTYGVLTGMALPCILFPSAVTNAVSSMLLPTVAGLQEMKDRQQLRSLILKITCSCILLGCFCCGVLLIFGKWIGIFLFKSPLAGNFILTLAWICPFLYTNTVLLSMINGLGKTTCSFLFNLCSLCIRIIGVFLFIPAAGISGYLNGLLVSQIFLFLCCILRLSVYAGKY